MLNNEFNGLENNNFNVNESSNDQTSSDVILNEANTKAEVIDSVGSYTSSQEEYNEQSNGIIRKVNTEVNNVVNNDLNNEINNNLNNDVNSEINNKMTSGLTNANDNYYGGNYSSYYTNQNENGNSYYSNSNDNINPYYNRNHNLDYNSNNNLNNNSNNNSNSNSNSNSNNNSNTNLNGYYSNYSQNEKQTSSQNQVPSQRGTYSSNSYNAYPNDHGTQQNYQTYQSSYQQSSYQQDAYQQDAYEQGAAADGTGKKGKHGKKVKKSNPMLRKFVACLALGIVSGGFAGVSFIAVKGIDNYINGEPNSSNKSVLEGVDFRTTEEEASSLLKTSNNITAVVTDVTNVVDNVMPSVVSITNMYTETGSFFGRTFEENVEASGSGIIVGENDSELLVDRKSVG